MTFIYLSISIICIALIFIMIVLYRIAVRIEDLEANVTSKTVDFKNFKVEIYDKINKLEKENNIFRGRIHFFERQIKRNKRK